MGAEEIIKGLDAEAELFGSNPTTEVATPDNDEQEVTLSPETPINEEISEVGDLTGEEDHTSPQRTNWKKRFVNYKASTDITISDLRYDNLSLRESVAQLMRRVEQLSQLAEQGIQKSDPFEGTFTEEEVQAFGEGGIDVIKKAAQTVVEKTVNPLKAELAETKAQNRIALERQLEQERKAEYNVFLAKLAKKAPNYQTLNNDPNFLQYLNQIPDGELVPRVSALRNAEAARDVVRVAEIFNDFDVKFGKAKVTNSLDRHLTPVGTGGSVADPVDRSRGAIDQSFINKFYSDFARGHYKGKEKEAQEIELKIDRYYQGKFDQRRGASR